MKRVNPVNLNPNGITYHQTYFKWSNCMKCGLDFRREKGVKWEWYGRHIMYMCNDCSHSANIPWVNEYVTWLRTSNNYRNPPQGR